MPAFLVLLAFAGTARANTTPTKVYLDSTTGRFGGPLPQDASRTITVQTLALPKAHLELSYWALRRGERCPEGARDRALTPAERDRATIRALAPVGNANSDGTQNYETTLGPLLYGVRYCFHLSGQEPRALETTEKADIGTALRSAIEGARIRQLEHGFPEGCPQVDSAAAQLCDLRVAFTKALPRRLATMEVSIPDTPDILPLPEAFELVVQANRSLYEKLGMALAIDTDRRQARNALLARKKELLCARDSSVPASNCNNRGVYRFDPLAGVGRDQIAALAQKDEVKAAIQAADDEPRALVRVLFTGPVYTYFIESSPWGDERQRASLAATSPKAVLYRLYHTKRGSAVELRSTGAPPPFITIDDAYRIEVANTIDRNPLDPSAGLKKYRDELAEVRRALGHDQASDIEVLYALDESIEGALAAAEIVKKLDEAFARDFAPKPDGSASVFVSELVDRMTAVRSLTTKNDFAFEPSYEKRFPLYASGDAGVALGLLPVRGDSPRPEVVAYFGLNVYFIAVDKEEPLRVRQSAGRNFLRRASVVGGVSFIRPTINEDELGIDGVVRRQVLLSGVGFRLTDYIRIGGGAMYLTQKSPNPLSDRKKLKVAPYFSLSIDVDIIGQINRWRGAAQSISATPPPPP